METAPINKIHIYFESMPRAIGGGVTTSDKQNGVYGIVINSNTSREVQRDTLAHELNHIFNNDFLNTLSNAEIEERADEIGLYSGEVS